MYENNTENRDSIIRWIQQIFFFPFFTTKNEKKRANRLISYFLLIHSGIRGDESSKAKKARVGFLRNLKEICVISFAKI